MAAISVNCNGGVGIQHLSGALARRGNERQEERRGKGTSAATNGDLLGIIFRQWGCNCEEAEATSVGGGG